MNFSSFLQEAENLLPKGCFTTRLSHLGSLTNERRGNFVSEPLAVVFPKNSLQVAELLKLANTYKVGVVPIGGNTGLTGGAVATKREILLSLKHFNKVKEIDTLNQVITLQAGVKLGAASEACAKKGLTFPLDLPSRDECTIGGNLATNAGGLNTVKYGPIRQNVLGIEVVLANGEIVKDLNKLPKRNLGLDYKNLFIGSEGCLGIVTAATVKLYPKSKEKIHVLLGLNSFGSLIKTYLKFTETFSGNISAFEAINQTAVLLSLNAKELFFPIKTKYRWYVLATIDFYENKADGLNMKEVVKSCYRLYDDNEVEEFYPTTNSEIWMFRDTLPSAQASHSSSIKNDIALPLNTMERALNKILERCSKLGEQLVPVIFGHLGDQSLHCNFLTKQTGAPLRALTEKVKETVTTIVIEHGGSFSAEHGIGLLNKRWLKKYYEKEHFYMLKFLKGLFDPNNILNPHKVLQLDY